MNIILPGFDIFELCKLLALRFQITYIFDFILAQ